MIGAGGLAGGDVEEDDQELADDEIL